MKSKRFYVGQRVFALLNRGDELIRKPGRVEAIRTRFWVECLVRYREGGPRRWLSAPSLSTYSETWASLVRRDPWAEPSQIEEVLP